MRETDFIKQNKEKWTELEEILKFSEKDPDKLSGLFVQVSDDLSYARTFYKNRSVRSYLNALAQNVFHNLYRTKSDRKKQFILFWKEELPQIVYESRKALLLSLLIFLFSALIGVISYANDPQFAHTILGKTYVDMTHENIKSGDPMAVYKKMNQVDMFLGISLNNIRVAFYTFIFGVLMAIGTIVILVYNGIMVGVFQYFFIQKGLFVESALALWLHGTLEISSIVIAGGAGITLGSGLLFPGTLPRMQSFQLSAYRGLKLLLGIVPILAFAAIIESFLTRYTHAPDLLRLSIILLSLFFILGYFVYYPYKKAKKGFISQLSGGRLVPRQTFQLKLKEIRSTGELFSDTFGIYRSCIKVISISIFSMAVVYLTAVIVIYPQLIFTFSFTSKYFFVFNLFNFDKYPLLFICNSIAFSVPLTIAFVFLKQRATNAYSSVKKLLSESLKKLYNALLCFLLLQLCLFLPVPVNILLFISLFPFFLLTLFIAIKEECLFFSAIPRMFQLLRNSLAQLLGSYFMMVFVSLVYYILVNSPLVYTYITALNWNLNLNFSERDALSNAIVLFTAITVFLFLIPLIGLAIGLLYFSLLEVNEAGGLKESIAQFEKKAK